MPSPRVILIGAGVAGAIVVGIIVLIIYTGYVGTKDLSWQTSFFFSSMIVIALIIAGVIGFRVGAAADGISKKLPKEE